MRYYIKEFLNQKYEIAAMDGYDAYVSIYNHEDIHLTSPQKETVSCSTVDNQYYYGIGQEECHDYCQMAQYLDIDRKSTRLNSSHSDRSRMPSSA